MNYRFEWLVFAVLIGAPGAGAAADKTAALLHPEDHTTVAEIKGQILDINPEERRLTVEDPAHQRVTVVAGPDVRLMDAENHLLAWSALRQKDHVDLYYDTQELRAIHIDVLPTAAQSLMGVPHF